MTKENKHAGGRPAGEKVRCSGEWTEARFNSFISSALRAATFRWKPKSDVKKAAKVRRGIYLCYECKEEVPASVKNEKGKRVNNAIVDHIIPIVDPDKGFTNWDDYVNRMFCEVDNLQVLCRPCHIEKSNEERRIAAERRKRERD